jgi:hypothetical protein
VKFAASAADASVKGSSGKWWWCCCLLSGADADVAESSRPLNGSSASNNSDG